MIVEVFELITNTTIIASIIKRDFARIYHQNVAQVDDWNQIIKFFFGENLKYIQIGKLSPDIEIVVKKADRPTFTDADGIRYANTDFGYVFQDATVSTSNGTMIEQNKNVGPFSTIMRLLTHKDGDLLTSLDKINKTRDEIVNTLLKPLLNEDHDVEAYKCKLKGNLHLGHKFGFLIQMKK